MAAGDQPDLARLDPQGMLATVEASGDQWDGALAVARDAPDPRSARLRSVVVCGMGGSGIAADVAQVAAHHHGTGVPVVPVKGYDLPSWVGPRTLVVAVSYSGHTEETLRCVEQAWKAGAQLAFVTSGGKLAEVADQRGVPVLRVPGGGQPRANLPNLVAPVLGLLDRAEVLSGVLPALRPVPDAVREAATAWRHDADDHVVAAAATTVGQRIPVFYGGSGFPAVLALRAKCQVNENAQRPAFHHELPELDHNEVVGWDRGAQFTAGCALIALRDRDEHPQISKRFEVTLDLVGDRFGTVLEHELGDGDPWVRFARGVLFVDLLSVHLALRDGVDPTPVEAIEQLKSRIAG